MNRVPPARWLPILTATLLLACESSGEAPPGEATTIPGETSQDGRRTTPDDDTLSRHLASMVLLGLQGLPDSVALTQGEWTDSTTRTAVALLPAFHLLGDLDGSGEGEIAFLVETSFGGTGQFQHLVVARLDGDALRSVVSQPLGDRVQLRSGALEGRTLVLDLVEHGPGDAACCPRLLTTRYLTFDGTALTEIQRIEHGRRTPEVLAGVEWILAGWDRGEAVDPALPEITLQYRAGGIFGSTGCNNYQGSFTEAGGRISVGPLAVTMRACAGVAGEREARFLSRLRAASGYSFFAGRVLVAGGEGEDFGWMQFRRR